MCYTNKTVLVTGGAGFIGSNVVKRLLDDGYKVVVIDNFDEYYSVDIKENNIKEFTSNHNFTLYRIDICNMGELEKVFKNHKIYSVIHLAAKAGVRNSINNPISYIKNNIEGTVNLLELMKKYNIKKIVFASSSSVYGNSNKEKFSEDDKISEPISPYAATKSSCEQFIYAYSYLFNINAVILRFFTVYGKNQRPDLAINKFVRLIKNNKNVDVYGDGTSYRDYTYIDDIVDGIISALNYDKSRFEIINLGGGKPVALKNLISIIEKLLSKSAKKNFMPMQMGDVLKTYADISKAKKILNYNPKFPIEKGLEEYIKTT